MSNTASPSSRVELVAKQPISLLLKMGCGCDQSKDVHTQAEAILETVKASKSACKEHTYVVMKREAYTKNNRTDQDDTCIASRELLSKSQAIERSRSLFQEYAGRQERQFGKLFVRSSPTKTGGIVTVENVLPRYTKTMTFTVVKASQIHD